MPRTLTKAKGRRENHSFVALPHHILESAEFAQLSSSAIRALLCLFGQFRGKNNGDFTAAWSVMQKRGWKSKGTLYGALKELQRNGWIVKTRQGGRNRCSLYGVTWLPIDECNGKLDIAPSRVPNNAWRKIASGSPDKDHAGSTVVPIRGVR
jgi:hypothetical protein